MESAHPKTAKTKPRDMQSPHAKRRIIATASPNTSKQASPKSKALSASPGSNEVIYESRDFDFLRNQLTALQELSDEDPLYTLTYQSVIDHLKSRPRVKTVIDEGNLRMVWDVYVDEEIIYRYEFIQLEKEYGMRCMFWTADRFIEMMTIRLAKGKVHVPILQVHNMGYIPLSLQGAQFTHHYYALEFFIRLLYSVGSISRRHRLLSKEREEALQTLPSNPMLLPVHVTINVPSKTFATEMQEVSIGTIQDVMLAKPKLPKRGAGSKKKLKQ